MISKALKSLKIINYRLFLALILMGLIPTIYTTVRIFFLGQMPGDWGYNIASQLSWVNLLYEVVQEALILPLFFLIGKSLSNNDELQNKIKTGFLATFTVYGVLSLLIIAFAKPMIIFMAQDASLISETVIYIRIETVANIFATLVKFGVIVLTVINKDKSLYLVLGVQMFTTIFFDIFFVSNLPVSLKLGVNGIAFTNIVVNIILLIIVFLLLSREKINLFRQDILSFVWMKEWLKVGSFSGIESFVRNFAFMMMIVRMVNVVGEQGTFWIANNFIWGWLLLPVLQFGELIKRDCGENQNAIKEKTLGYFSITTIIVVIWGITIPVWPLFIKNVMNVANYKDVFFIAIISIGFYVLFAFNNVIDSIFYGIGKTNYMLFQSLVINILYYGTAFVLYTIKIYIPTFTSIALMFAIGTALDSILTYFIFFWFLKNKNIKMQWFS